MDIDTITSDLVDEHDALSAVLQGLTPADWRSPTPSVGWTVADQISHLQFFDERALLAITNPEEFTADRDALVARAPDDLSIELGRRVSGEELFASWRRSARRLTSGAVGLDASRRLPWYGPAMSAVSFLTARLMECWTHGHDVAVATGRPPVITSRLRHVAHIGVGARPFSLRINGLESDDRPVHVRLDAPDGSSWTWGPPDAEHRVEGDAYDFCLVVTQRREANESGLRVSGEAARTWIAVAQAFAGPPRTR